jgi:hypothetical protein
MLPRDERKQTIERVCMAVFDSDWKVDHCRSHSPMMMVAPAVMAVPVVVMEPAIMVTPSMRRGRRGGERKRT